MTAGGPVSEPASARDVAVAGQQW